MWVVSATPKPNGGGFGHPKIWPWGWLSTTFNFFILFFKKKNRSNKKKMVAH